MLMKRSLPLALAVLFVVVLAENSTHGQTRRRSSTPATPNSAATTVQKRRVILDLIGQAPIGADFIQADATSITVEIAGARRVLKMDEVVSIIFSPDEATKRLSKVANSRSVTAAHEALKILRRVNSATELGMSRNQYSELLIEAKGTIDEALASIPASELKNEIALAIEAYTDAKQAWDAMVRQKGRYSESETMILGSGLRGLVEKYSVPTGRSKGFVNDETMIKTIWQAANAHIMRATSLMSQ